MPLACRQIVYNVICKCEKIGNCAMDIRARVGYDHFELGIPLDLVIIVYQILVHTFCIVSLCSLSFQKGQFVLFDR